MTTRDSQSASSSQGSSDRTLAELPAELVTARRALACLYIAVEEDVAADVSAKCEAAFSAFIDRERSHQQDTDGTSAHVFDADPAQPEFCRCGFHRDNQRLHFAAKVEALQQELERLREKLHIVSHELGLTTTALKASRVAVANYKGLFHGAQADILTQATQASALQQENAQLTTVLAAIHEQWAMAACGQTWRAEALKQIGLLVQSLPSPPVEQKEQQ
jgi:hypothetical protein